MTELTSHQLATVTGGSEADEVARIRRAGAWYSNVLEQGAAAGSDLGAKGSAYGAVIGFGGAAATGVGLPAAGLAAVSGAGTGWGIGYGMGFAYGAGREIYRNWNDRPWK